MLFKEQIDQFTEVESRSRQDFCSCKHILKRFPISLGIYFFLFIIVLYRPIPCKN